MAKSATTGSTLASERRVREVEAAATGKVGKPEVGRVARVIGQRAVLAGTRPSSGRGRPKSSAPRVMVERDDP